MTRGSAAGRDLDRRVASALVGRLVLAGGAAVSGQRGVSPRQEGAERGLPGRSRRHR